MTRRNAKTPAIRGQAAAVRDPAPERTSSVVAAHWRLLAGAAVLPVLATLILFAFEIPLGKPGKFVYLYSPIVMQRLGAVPAALAIGTLLACSVALVCSPHPWRRRAGYLLAAVGCVGGTGWIFVAPPQFRSQHVLNMQSPSHDGAFLLEAAHARGVGVRAYLRSFPERTRKPPAEMRGTRVISNPPAMTLIAVGTLSLLEHSPRVRRAVAAMGLEDELPAELARIVIDSIGLAFALALLGLLAAPLLYAANRVLVSAPVALTLALVVSLSPMTLLFGPGKDPVQMSTVGLLLWLWLLAWRGERGWAAVLAGGVFVLVCLISLVHVWIAAIVFVAGVLSTPTGGRLRFILRNGVPAAAGAAVVVLALAVLADLDFFRCAWFSARAQSEITRGDDAMPFVWQSLGVPLFLLFAGPAFWCVSLWRSRGGQRERDADARFGACLVAGSAVVMLATVGFTNVETPRLWMPFMPLLLLGGALRIPAMRNVNRRLAIFLGALVLVQVAASALQWTVMDMREAETRLLLSRDGGPRYFY